MVSGIRSLLLLSTAVGLVLAQSPAYGQCKSTCSHPHVSTGHSLIHTPGGGQGWDGPKTCVSGSCCTFSNDWYSQCIPGNCNGGGGGGEVPSSSTTLTTRTSTAGSSNPTQTFTNPVLWEDLADNDVFRVGSGTIPLLTLHICGC